MARGPTPQVEITEGLQPRSEIYDSYVRPAEPQKSNLHELAASLQSLSGDLASAAKVQANEKAKEDKIAGRAAFWSDNETGAAEGVRQGLIPNFLSPGFSKGYQEAAGNAAGVRLDAIIGQSYSDSDIKTSEDPEAFNKFFRGQVQDAFGGNKDPNFLKGATAHIEQAHAKYSSIWTKDRQQYQQGRAETSFTAAMGSTLDQYWKAGQSSETGMDLVAAGQAVSGFRDAAFKIGLEKAKADQLAVDAVVAKAVEYKDERILQTLTQLKDGGGPQVGGSGGPENPVTLAQSAYGRDQIAQATKAIQSLKHAEAERARTENARLDKADKEDATRKIVEGLLKDPMSEIPEDLLKRGEKTDGNYRVDMITLRGNILNGLKQENPTKIATLTKDLIAGGGMDAIRKAIGSGDLHDPATIKNAYDLANLVEKNTQGDMKILDSSGFQRIEKMIQTKFVDPSYKGSIYKEAGLTAAGDAAMNDARMEVMKWAVDHPKATRLEMEDYLQKVGQRYRDTLGEDKGGSPTYVQPADIQRPAESPQNPTLPAGERSPPPKTSPLSPLTQILHSGSAPPKFQDLPKLGLDKAAYDKFIADSKALGVNPQDRLDRAFKSIQEHKNQQPATGKRSEAAPGSEAPQPASFQPPTAASFGGLGTLEFPGLDPEAVKQIRAAMEHHAPGLMARIEKMVEAVSPRRVAEIDRSPVGPLADQEARAAGFDPAKLKAIISIESGGRADVSTGSYHGLLQLSASEFREHGGKGNIKDPAENLRAGIKSLQQKEATFKGEFGREPSATELYLMHQQGEAGLRSHMANPTQAAWQSMAQTGEGRNKGPSWAKRAVWGNVPQDYRARFGSVENITSADFVAIWLSKLQGIPLETALRQVKGSSPV